MKKAFAKARGSLSGPGVGIRYPANLRQMAVDAIHDGLAISEVLDLTGVAGTTLAVWLRGKKKAVKAKSGAVGRRGKRPVQRLKVVQEQRAPASVSMFVGRDIRLEIPTEMLSADLIRRLAQAPT